MLSYIFYLFYFVICFSSLYFITKNKLLILVPLFFTSQFNVTSFLKAGITISFFELNLILTTLAIVGYQSLRKRKIFENISFKKQDAIWFLFLAFSFLSVFISIIRVNLGDLTPDPDFEPVYYARSIMSLNKFFFYLPCFYIIRGFLYDYYDELIIQNGFLRIMAFAGLLPVIAILIQYLNLGFTLIHNNPSFSETFRVERYLEGRPVGLTNEASFFVYQLFFSAMALYYAWKRGLFTNIGYYSLTSFYVFGVIISISRTGLLIFALFYIIVWLRESKFFTIKGFFKVLKFTPVIILVIAVLSNISIDGFNMGDRLLSSFKQGADASTLERYGSAEAIFRLFIDKGLLFGIGIYNYQYYIKSYIPDYMDMFYYPKGVAPASFNFIFQLFVEFGLFFAILFFYKLKSNIFNVYNDIFFKDWFLFLLIFSFSFQTLNFAIPFLIFFYPSRVTE